jgi:crotonobetainyl-CoA:carnitine CoA-transferase CaiB-like acyl-CoA transferase
MNLVGESPALRQLDPYAGLRVLDLSTNLAGAFSSMHLADFGADVVRWHRSSIPARGSLREIDVGLLCANRNKRVVDLERGSDGWLQHVRRLANRADVVVTDSPVASLERLRIDPTSLMSANADLVYVHVPPFGRVGTASVYPEDALLLEAISGVADYHFATTERPVAPVVPFLLYQQGALAATAAAAALFDRRRSGEGRLVTVSGLHAVAAMNTPVMLTAPGLVRLVGDKNASQGAPNFQKYLCQDGRWMFLGALTPPFFFKALEALDALDLMLLPGLDGEFLNLRDPAVSSAAIEYLQRIFATRPLAYWRALLDEAGVPNAPIEPREAWVKGSLLSDNRGVVAIETQTYGLVQVPNVAVMLSQTPGSVRSLSESGVGVDAATIWDDVPPGRPRRVNPTPDRRCRPLKGLRILDLGTFIAGSFGPSILCDFGAEVVKVEAPGGDPYRIFSAAYAAINQGKASVTLDLKDPRDVERLHAIVPFYDVLFDNVRPGAQQRLGTDYLTLKVLNPDLVRCSITAWGESPISTPAFDPLIQARSGLMTAQGGTGDPVVQVMPVHDIACGTIGAFGALTALYVRDRLGTGQEVLTSLVQASLVVQAVELTTFPARPVPPLGAPDYSGDSDLHRLYQCEDGWIALGAQDLDGVTAPTLAGILASGPRDCGGRVAAHGPVPGEPIDGAADLAGAIRSQTVEVVLDRLAETGVPAVAVLSRGRLFDDPWLAGNRFFRQVEDAGIGTVTTVRGFADWEDVADDEIRRTAALGEDNGALISADAPDIR